MSNGWIKLHRQITKWEWYQDSKTLHLFIHLLLNANHKEGRWQGNTVKRGQLITGRIKLATDTGLTSQVIRSCLKKLESSSDISQKSTNKFTTITIINYDTYNSENIEANKQITNKQQTDNKQITTNNNVKKEKNVKNRFKPPSLSSVSSYCSERNNNIDPQQFIDYYTSTGWFIGKNKMKDWQAAIRTWENRNNAQNKPNHGVVF